jgi:putative phosphoesterase
VRVAALYDIHGNLPALEAVLAELDRESIDLIVIGGDFVWGPFPRETVDLLHDLGERAAIIRGNADREVAQPQRYQAQADEVTASITDWCAEQLSVEQRRWLLRLPETLSVEIDALGATLFCHGSPRNDEESLTELTPEPRLREALKDTVETIIVCGHTHMQFDRTIGSSRVVNAGSMGLPYQGEAGAYWTILGPEVSLRRTSYDINAAVQSFMASSCPHVQEAFVEPLLHPPSAEETARHFEARTLRKKL